MRRRELLASADGIEWATVVDFLERIGIPVAFARIMTATPYAGILINCGVLRVDRTTRPALGDLLHEAAHIAVAPPSRRLTDSGDLQVNSDEEIATIAWCWAAMTHLALPPERCFDAKSRAYRDRCSDIVTRASLGQCPGVGQLQAWNMASTRFPEMISWIREIAL